jgi:hypothetical protein
VMAGQDGLLLSGQDGLLLLFTCSCDRRGEGEIVYGISVEFYM